MCGETVQITNYYFRKQKTVALKSYRLLNQFICLGYGHGSKSAVISYSQSSYAVAKLSSNLSELAMAEKKQFQQNQQLSSSSSSSRTLAERSRGVQPATLFKRRFAACTVIRYCLTHFKDVSMDFCFPKMAPLSR